MQWNFVWTDSFLALFFMCSYYMLMWFDLSVFWCLFGTIIYIVMFIFNCFWIYCIRILFIFNFIVVFWGYCQSALFSVLVDIAAWFIGKFLFYCYNIFWNGEYICDSALCVLQLLFNRSLVFFTIGYVMKCTDLIFVL